MRQGQLGQKRLLCADSASRDSAQGQHSRGLRRPGDLEDGNPGDPGRGTPAPRRTTSYSPLQSPDFRKSVPFPSVRCVKSSLMCFSSFFQVQPHCCAHPARRLKDVALLRRDLRDWSRAFGNRQWCEVLLVTPSPGPGLGTPLQDARRAGGQGGVRAAGRRLLGEQRQPEKPRALH